MTPAQWEKAGEVFHAALELPEGEREQWVRNTCDGDAEVLAEVLSLLESDGAAQFFASQVEPALASLAESSVPARHPLRVGPYRLVRQLGQGGMGTVYLGERDDDEYKTEVAIKLVRRGYDTDLILNRFYRERQTLARLHHPNIARLLDGGTTPDGMPYIVMEFIEGTQITEYCRERDLGVAQRLLLFLDVCKAVDYAHRQFVVHRDLKPGNIMVDKSGAVKLLDFGICKLLQAEPRGDDTVESGPLTPGYASPEQMRGDPVTVASDIYSLAAVLYELLTGAKPHQLTGESIHEVERRICEEEVREPSSVVASRSLARQLEGDLDTILMFALQREPERRYASVEQFAEDIRRYLSHQPVTARKDTLAYRLRKLLRRRGGTIAAAAAVVAALSAGTILSIRSARIANENLALVRRLSNTFVFDVYDSVRELPGSTKARQLIVRTGLEYLDNLSRNAANDSGLQRELASAYRRIGDVQGDVTAANLGDTNAAIASYGKALGLLDAVLRAEPGERSAILEWLIVTERLGSIRASGTDPAGAIDNFARAGQRAEAWLRDHPGDPDVSRRLAELHNLTANAMIRQGDYDGARKAFVRAQTLLLPLEGQHADHLDIRRSLAVAFAGIGRCDSRAGRLKEALANHRNAIERAEALVSAAPDNVSLQRLLMISYSHAGDVLGNPRLSNLGDPAGAGTAYEKMAAVAQRIHVADPADLRARSDYGIALGRLALIQLEQDRHRGIVTMRKSLTVLDEALRVAPGNALVASDFATFQMFLGDALRATGEPGPAIEAYRISLDRVGKLVSGGAPATATAFVMTCRKLGEMIAAQGHRAESLDLARRALEFAKPGSPGEKTRAAAARPLLVARAHGAAGSILAVLAAGPARAESDRAEAANHLRLGLEAYAKIRPGRPLSADLKAEMRALDRYLEAVK